MDYENVKELIGIVNSSALTEFEYRKGDFLVKMSKNCLNVSSVENRCKNDLADKSETVIIPDEISEPITIIPSEKVEIKAVSLVKAHVVLTFYQN